MRPGENVFSERGFLFFSQDFRIGFALECLTFLFFLVKASPFLSFFRFCLAKFSCLRNLLLKDSLSIDLVVTGLAGPFCLIV